LFQRSPSPSGTRSFTHGCAAQTIRVGLAWRRSDPRTAEFSALADRLKQIAGSFDIGVDAI
jgi:hypothetical protein